ncbi:MAG: AAA family ATPase [Thermodesulfobacteriota bacterium]
MTANTSHNSQVPWEYVRKHRRKGTEIDQMIGGYIHDWERQKTGKKPSPIKPDMPPTICFSRPIGCGVMEIADILAKSLGYRVVDRDILEHVGKEAALSDRAVRFFNEQYPDIITQYLMMMAGDKAFDMSKTTKQLFSAIFSIANLSPTIFIGRGAYLVLPRDRTLTVRFICSRGPRIKRIAQAYGMNEAEADKQLTMIDKEQRDFFKAVYRKETQSPEEFDMVINCDRITEPAWAAGIVKTAFEHKFGKELKALNAKRR